MSDVPVHTSEGLYRSLVESIDEGFCVIEVIFNERDEPVDYRFLEINPAFERQTGLPDARGRTVRSLIPGHESHWFEIYGRVAVTGQPIRFEHGAAQLGRWYDVYAWRHGPPEGRQVGVLFRDVTARRQVEEQGRRHREELEEAVERRTRELSQSHRQAAAAQRMAAVGTLAAGLAHDMSNLTLPLGLRLAALTNRPGLDDDVRSELAIISTLLDHLRTLSRNLSLFSRDPNQDGVIGRANVSQWRDSVRKFLDASLGPGISVEWRCDPECPDIGVAPHRLTQIVQNLVHNSRNALLSDGGAPKPGARIVVSVRAGSHPRTACIAVIDNGAGMDEPTAQRAIEPFFTTRDRPEHAGAGGSGLGLSLAHQIVERAGGTLTINSTPGVGTTVTIVLPTAGSEP